MCVEIQMIPDNNQDKDSEAISFNQEKNRDDSTTNLKESGDSMEILEIGKQKISWQQVVLLILSSTSLLILGLILIFTLIDSFPIFSQYGIFKYLFGNTWNPQRGQYGVLHAIIGTFLVVIVAMILAIPLGISVAVYMAEIAPEKIRKVLKPTIELLASIPSVIYGFFGLFTVVPAIKWLFKLPTGETGLAGSIILAIMVLPTIISISDDALHAVPQRFREGSFALGATKWQTIWRVILPAAMSGITASIILGFGRAIGETMAVYMVSGGATNMPKPFFNILTSLDPLTVLIAREIPEAAENSLHFYALFGTAVVLFVITFAINLTGDILVRRYAKKLRGED
ncbi:MAG: phosphate ABC transporter permease subunit PstC [Asgard group archaeon]|nr:phosphate ABC transporter permease subunit PstC [Asgard group archaeon]